MVELLKEPQHDDGALQLRQLGDQPGQGEQVLRLVPGSGGGQQVAKAAVGILAERLVERDFPAAPDGSQPLQHLLHGQLQVVGEFHGAGRAAEGLLELVIRPAQLQGSLLEWPGDVDPPGGVPQVPFELPDHAGDREGNEPAAATRLVAVHGRDERGPSGLGEVLHGGPATCPIARRQPLGEPQVG
jgi:hypothetical protein